jgi:(E)-4-hydroxy-3-methylbut-2-enyl-diphosphate synthase
MGCPVNGPGEAREADIGVACAREGGILFSYGKPIGRVSTNEIVDTLLKLASIYPNFPEGAN